jgi:4-aminobutyrate aminotransferase-like enzyme
VSGGTGFIVTEAAYHGNTQSVTEISPSAYKRGTPPGHVCVIAAPSEAAYGQDVARGMTEAVAHAIEALAGRGHQLAGLICDSIFSSDGVFADPAGFLQAPVELVRKAGGLYIADEVQPGFARTGDSFWGFARHHLQPDIVTLGKPMGNGFPMAAVAAPTGAMAAFCKDFGYFNTFGGTPAAAAAGLAVLDVIEEEQLQDNALKVGRHLQQGLQRLAATDPRIAATRGAGLFIGVDLGKSAGHDAPDPELASAVINRLRDRQVLIGAAGRFGNTLKIRPPLCLSTKEADFFLDALRSTLHSIPADETGH